jgi:aldose 1-epimerase
MPATIESEIWGRLDERPVRRWTLVNERGFMLRAIELGTIVTELHVPDASGALADVVLGRASLADYVAGHPYFGCTAGRCANRIAFGRMPIDGEVHQLARNDGPHHLHGGTRGFDKMIWSSGATWNARGPQVRFQRTSPDGEEGYPGTVSVTVRYCLTDDGTFEVELTAVSDAPTVVNLAHHTYWNLGGHASGTILDHELRLHASHYTPVDATLIPTGEIAPVAGSAFDFRTAKPIGRDMGAAGWDHNFVLDGAPGRVRPVARLRDPRSGRVMELATDQRGLQFYSGHKLAGLAGKDGAVYERCAGLCLESQLFPNAINEAGRPGWPDAVLRPAVVYRHRMIHRFTSGK